MRTVVIGGTGHIGTYLVPHLVETGCEVINISRGQRQPYQPHSAWKHVQSIVIDREAADKAGTFGDQIRDLRPDVVIDNKCYTVDSARRLVEALRGQVQHLIVCGTLNLVISKLCRKINCLEIYAYLPENSHRQ